MNNSATTRRITKIAIEYNGNDKGTAERVYQNNLLSQYPEQQFTEMKTVADRNKNVKNWALTEYISPEKSIGDQLSNEELTQLALRALKKIGVSDNNQMVLDIHSSTKQKHIHFIVNRVNIHGENTIKAHNIGELFGKAVREVCKEMNLKTDIEIGKEKKKQMLKALTTSLRISRSFEELTNNMKKLGYCVTLSQNEKVKKPQFHAVIYTKFQEHNKEELTKVAEDFMQEMGYGNQPFIVISHNDTENNHVHIVSTRVDKSTGKKINDSYEKLKAQKAMMNIKERMFGKNNEKIINSLLSYKISSLKQLEILMERNGFKLVKNKNDENALDILKNSVCEKAINGNQLIFSNPKNDNRAKQIKAILNIKNCIPTKFSKWKTEDI